MITLKDSTIPERKVNGGVVRVVKVEDEHTSGFSVEWTNFPKIQTDSTLKIDFSKTRLELNMGLPLTFLKGMRVFELGCGPGRFTEQFAKYADEVVAVDLSDAIYSNSTLGAPNVLHIKADLMDVPELTEPIDLVFCRGVIKHTVSPRDTIKKLFTYARPGGLVIFDVYKKHSWHWRTFKYFWRPVVQRLWSAEVFNKYTMKHGAWLYTLNERVTKFISYIPPLNWIFIRTPFYIGHSYDREYPLLTREQKIETFKADLIDALYANHDQPMTPQEVIDCTAEIGQLPYSYDKERNHFRYVKSDSHAPVKVKFTRNGVVRV